MKHQIYLLSALTLLLACSAAEEGAGPAAGGAIGFAGAGAGGFVAAAGTAGQSGGGVAGGVAGASGGFAGATAGTGGMTTAGAGGVAGAPGGAGGQGGASAGAAGGGAGGASGGGGAGGAAQSPEQALYTTNCSTCHGATGEGGQFGPEIRHPVEDFTIWMVRNGSDARNPNTTYPGPMVPLDTAFISDAELAMVLTYLNSFPQPTTGPELFMDYCANCHGADGKGAATTRDLTMLANPMTDVPMQVRDGAHGGEFEMLIEYMPARDMTELTDAELMLIATHVASL